MSLTGEDDPSKVFLRVYSMGQLKIENSELEIYHTSVEVFGKEHSYGKDGVVTKFPTPQSCRILLQGNASGISQETFDSFVSRLYNTWTPSSYHPLYHNCFHFTELLLQYLKVADQPKYLAEFQEKFKLWLSKNKFSDDFDHLVAATLNPTGGRSSDKNAFDLDSLRLLGNSSLPSEFINLLRGSSFSGTNYTGLGSLGSLGSSSFNSSLPSEFINLLSGSRNGDKNSLDLGSLGSLGSSSFNSSLPPEFASLLRSTRFSDRNSMALDNFDDDDMQLLALAGLSANLLYKLLF